MTLDELAVVNGLVARAFRVKHKAEVNATAGPLTREALRAQYAVICTQLAEYGVEYPPWTFVPVDPGVDVA